MSTTTTTGHEPEHDLIASLHQRTPQQRAGIHISVLTTPSCSQCTVTCNQFDKKGYQYDTLLATDNPEMFDFARQRGFLQAPVVFVHDNNGEILDAWSGFRPDKIMALGKTINARANLPTTAQTTGAAPEPVPRAQERPALNQLATRHRPGSDYTIAAHTAPNTPPVVIAQARHVSL
ncbi:Glutaredoxin [Micrococcales bacterium KH10]|nr:Glutaredoxin [Micrococcales bacterium KH10]